MDKFWSKIGESILANKIKILLIVAIATIGLGFIASKIQLSYELAKILPKTDSRFQLYENFKKKYGEDGSVIVIGLENPNLFTPKEFTFWKNLHDSIRTKHGIKNVLSLSNIPEVYIDSINNTFKTRNLWDAKSAINQTNLERLKGKLERLPIFKNFLYTEDFSTHLMMITFGSENDQ